MIDRAIVIPIPSPWGLVVTNDLNNRGIMSLSIPVPVSRTVKLIKPGSPEKALTSISRGPSVTAPTESNAFKIRFIRTCWSRMRSAANDGMNGSIWKSIVMLMMAARRFTRRSTSENRSSVESVDLPSSRRLNKLRKRPIILLARWSSLTISFSAPYIPWHTLTGMVAVELGLCVSGYFCRPPIRHLFQVRLLQNKRIQIREHAAPYLASRRARSLLTLRGLVRSRLARA
jgi:hypothetical protein